MYIIIRGVISNSGFGQAVQGLMRTAIKAGHEVGFIPVNCHAPQHRKGFDEATLAWLDSITIPEDTHTLDKVVIDVGSLIYGLQIPKIPCKKSIFYCTYETIKIHPEYVNMMNSKFDEIWTASNFNKVSFISSGVNKPVKVIPHYIDESNFPLDAKPLAIENKRGFNFLFNADFSYRKGLHLLLPAFIETFTETEDVSLTLKLTKSNPDPDKTREDIIKTLYEIIYMRGLGDKPHAPILVYVDYVPYSKLVNMYKSADCYVSPHYGEGFAYTIAEAMLSELPVISSRCTAPVDYLKRDFTYFVDLDEKNPTIPLNDPYLLKIDPHYQGQSLYNPSFDSLKTAFRTAFDNKDKAKDKGKLARTAIEKYCSLDRLATIFNEII